MKKIRVLVVEDSLLFKELLIKNLNLDPEIEVVASAENPFEARDAIIDYKPDVMTLDIELPKMDGIEFLRKLMPQYPLPTVMISSLSDKVFDALYAGAVDFVAKPQKMDIKAIEEFVRVELPSKIKAAAVANVSNRKMSSLASNTGESTSNRDTIIAIGASTGGTEATAAVLKSFGKDVPGIVITQHMPPGFTKMYADRLNRQCEIEVREARSGDYVQPGLALIAPGGDQHMKVVKVGNQYQVVLFKGPKINGLCPAVEVLFESVARTAGSNAIGIILTGMGKDGADGLLQMRKAGARTIGQDASTCVVYGMPKVAYEIGAVEYQEKLSDIARRTYTLLNNK